MDRNMNVTVIPARTRIGNNVDKESKPKLRVAAYCRVSTDSDEQATSYEAQVEHYRSYITNNDDWDFAGIFADDGISGTNTKKREEFNRMIEECNNGHIDMIITKSISRFARNTLDCLKFIRELKEKNIPVFFEKENINTMDSKGEVLLTIMASLAQQESESLSKNVKMGLQFRYQNGEVQVNHSRFMGYTKDENGKLIIEPNEAIIIKRIFREFLEGASLRQVCNSLMADNILTAANMPKWRPETVRKILTNEKYIGDALLQKTYTVDVLTKKRVKNNGIMPQYYVENCHEPIIPKDLFMQVEKELLRRSNLYTNNGKKKRAYSGKFALSSIVICPICGDTYRRVAWNNRGKRKAVWRCITRAEQGPTACKAPTIDETTLQDAVMEAINITLGDKDTVLTALEQNIKTVLNQEDDNSILSIDTKLREQQEELLNRVNAKQDYTDVADEIDRLRALKQAAMAENAEREGVKQRLCEMSDFFSKQTQRLEIYDEPLVRKIIEKVTVQEDSFLVEFKNETKVEVEWIKRVNFIAP